MQSSVLIFEINKKFLLFKILSKEFHDSLRNEVIKKFGSKYVDEKNNQTSGYAREHLESNETACDTGIINSDEEEESETEDTGEEENDGSTTEVDDTAENVSNKKRKKRKKLILTNDLVYEYFSPIVNSFEISKEINYIYEYTLFKKNQHIIRFNLHKNCLFMCIQDLNASTTGHLASPKSEMTNLIYSDFTSGFNM